MNSFLRRRCAYRYHAGQLCRYYVDDPEEELCYYHRNEVEKDRDDFYSNTTYADISEGSYRLIDSYSIGYRLSNKERMEDIHFKIKVKGPAASIELFHSLVGYVDSDYPYNPWRLTKDKVMRCTQCGGYVWNRCMLSEKDINAAAKQCGVVAKIKKFLPKWRCTNTTLVEATELNEPSNTDNEDTVEIVVVGGEA